MPFAALDEASCAKACLLLCYVVATSPVKWAVSSSQSVCTAEESRAPSRVADQMWHLRRLSGASSVEHVAW